MFRNFTGLQQRACERLLLELVVLDENFEEPLRRRRDETELISAMQLSGYAAADIGRVISDFVGHYLVRRFGDTPDSQLEVAHEALLRNWPHITDILTGSNVKERLHLVQEIRREAVEWLDRGRRDDELRVHGDRLVRAVTSATQGWLVGRTAAEYIAACQRREAENRGRDKRLRVLRWWVTVAWVIVLPLIGGSILSFLYVRTIQERNDQLKVIENAFDAMTGLSDLLLLDAVNDIARRDTLPPAVLTKILKSASSAYDPIILRSQGNAVAYNGRGSARLADPENPEIGAAIEDFTRAIELQQDNASYHNNRGSAYRRAADLDPGNKRGTGLRRADNLDRAIQDYDKAINLGSDEAWYLRCFTLSKKPRYPEALQDCDKSLALKPSNAAALIARGYIKLELFRKEAATGPLPGSAQDFTQLNGAIEDLTKAIGINPTSSYAYGNRGEAYLLKRELDPAINDFNLAIALNPKNAAANYYLRGFALRNKGDVNGAITNYNTALELDQSLDKARRARCFARAILGALEDALVDCNESLKKEPSIAGTYDSRGLVYLKLGKFNNAIADYDAALRLSPKHAGALYGRGLAKLKLGDAVGGNSDIAAAETIIPQIGEEFASYRVQ